jgi:hypothetical protein
MDYTPCSWLVLSFKHRTLSPSLPSSEHTLGLRAYILKMVIDCWKHCCGNDVLQKNAQEFLDLFLSKFAYSIHGQRVETQYNALSVLDHHFMSKETLPITDAGK